MKFADLPQVAQDALKVAFPGRLLQVRVPKRDIPMQERVREQYDAYVRVYQMGHEEALREITVRFRVEGRKVTVEQVEEMLKRA